MEGYIGEIRIFAGNFAPLAWEFCRGQLQSIQQYEALFSIIGTTYGGDGQVTFALPDLQGRVPIGCGQGPGLGYFTLGQTGGLETVQVSTLQIPAHTHVAQVALRCSSGAGDHPSPVGRGPAVLPGVDGFRSAPTELTASSAGVLQASGGSQPHDNRSPQLALNYIICVEGIYPSQS